MNSTFLMLFMLLALLGCNTEMADLGRISARPPMVIQLGAVTKLPGMSNSLTDACSKVAVDSFENIVCVGSTQSSMAKAADGSQDAFAAKFDRNGKLLWVVQLQSSGAGTDSGTAVGIDSSNNIYVGGNTTKMIGTGTILNKQFVNPAYVWLPRQATATDLDGFVAKISPSGQLQWVKQFGSVSSDGCNNLAVSPSGNSYCGSSTDGEIGTDAISGIDEYLGGTSINPIVVKIDTNANIKWIRQFGAISQPGQYHHEDKCSDLKLDDDENVYCGGYTYGNIGDTNGSGNTAQDVMVWILDKNGFTQRILQVGVTADANPNVVNVNGHEACEEIAVDKQKNIYCAVTTTSAFGEAGGGSYDFIVMKWNSSGQIQWVSQLGSVTELTIPGYDSSSVEVIHSIAVDIKGNIVAAGSTSGPSAGPSNGSDDALMASFSPDGHVNWIRQYGSSASDSCGGVTSDNVGNVYCAGITTGSFGETNAGSSDGFILRVDPLGNL